MMQPLKRLGFYESFWMACQRDRNLHILNRAVAENGAKITQYLPQMLVFYVCRRLSSGARVDCLTETNAVDPLIRLERTLLQCRSWLFSLVALSLCWSFNTSDVFATISDTFSKSSKSLKNPHSNVGSLLAIIIHVTFQLCLLIAFASLSDLRYTTLIPDMAADLISSTLQPLLLGYWSSSFLSCSHWGFMRNLELSTGTLL